MAVCIDIKKDINKKIYDITGGYIKKNIPCGFFELKINKNKYIVKYTTIIYIYDINK